MPSRIHHDDHRDDDHRHDRPHSASESDDSVMAELLDLDAEVLHSYLSEVTAWIQDLTTAASPRRILDLGSGTGTGTFALLRRFSGADAVALDLSPPLLHHLRDKARVLGVADRVRTMQVDLDAAWPAVDPVDLIWAASSLHHLTDPDRVLSDVFAALRPGGLLVVAEMDSLPRFLPDELHLGRAGLETRIHAALAEAHARELPNLGCDWGSRLSRAGFTIQAERSFPIELTAPLPAAAGRYAKVSLQRIRSHLDTRISADDLATLDTLLDNRGPDGVLHRDDLIVRTTRTVWAASRR